MCLRRLGRSANDLKKRAAPPGRNFGSPTSAAGAAKGRPWEAGLGQTTVQQASSASSADSAGRSKGLRIKLSHAHSAALEPSPAAMTICLYSTVVTSPAANTPGRLMRHLASTTISPNLLSSIVPFKKRVLGSDRRFYEFLLSCFFLRWWFFHLSKCTGKLDHSTSSPLMSNRAQAFSSAFFF